MRQEIREPSKATRLVGRLRRRTQVNERFRKFVADMRRLVVEGCYPPRWLLEAAKLVSVDETKRLYIITQKTPPRTPGPKPQRKDDDKCGGSSA